MMGAKICPGCLSLVVRVADTRVKKDGTVIRIRRCKKCGYAWATVEILEDDYTRLKRYSDNKNSEKVT